MDLGSPAEDGESCLRRSSARHGARDRASCAELPRREASLAMFARRRAMLGRSRPERARGAWAGPRRRDEPEGPGTPSWRRTLEAFGRHRHPRSTSARRPSAPDRAWRWTEGERVEHAVGLLLHLSRSAWTNSLPSPTSGRSPGHGRDDQLHRVRSSVREPLDNPRRSRTPVRAREWSAGQDARPGVGRMGLTAIRSRRAGLRPRGSPRRSFQRSRRRRRWPVIPLRRFGRPRRKVAGRDRRPGVDQA
jgi:hypothetical protein